MRAFNPLSDEDQRIFKALLSGDNTINGFRNRDVRERLADTPFLRTCGKNMCKRSAKVTRLLKRLQIYGLIAKVPRSRRWRLTKKGWALLEQIDHLTRRMGGDSFLVDVRAPPRSIG